MADRRLIADVVAAAAFTAAALLWAYEHGYRSGQLVGRALGELDGIKRMSDHVFLERKR